MHTAQDRSRFPSWLEGRGLMVVFTAGSAAAFLFVGVLVHMFLADQIRERERGFDEFHAAFTVESVLAGQLTPADLDAPVTGPRYDELADFTRELVLLGGVVRVKVWNQEGTVVFSDDPDLVGESFDELPPALARAFAGEVHGHLTRLDEELRDDPRFSELPGLLLETYVPIRTDGAGRPVAVGEIHQDFVLNEAAAASAVRRMDLYLGGGLVLLYALLLPLVRSTAGRLQDQTRQLSRLLASERATVERLDELNEMKNFFVTAVSHELRTPLTVVRGVSQTLMAHRGVLSDEQIGHLVARLDHNAGRLDELLRDLLDLNRLLRGDIRAQRQPTDLEDVIRAVERRVKTDDHDVRIDSQVGEIRVDAGLVERIVENLLDNAVQHTPPGTSIWLRTGWRDGDVEIVVADAGPGVPVSEREAVFEAFTHGSATTAHSPGTGIGLSLVSRFAQLHDGHAWVEDCPGGGASFHVTLGVAAPDEDVEPEDQPDRAVHRVG